MTDRVWLLLILEQVHKVASDAALKGVAGAEKVSELAGQVSEQVKPAAAHAKDVSHRLPLLETVHPFLAVDAHNVGERLERGRLILTYYHRADLTLMSS